MGMEEMTFKAFAGTYNTLLYCIDKDSGLIHVKYQERLSPYRSSYLCSIKGIIHTWREGQIGGHDAKLNSMVQDCFYAISDYGQPHIKDSSHFKRVGVSHLPSWRSYLQNKLFLYHDFKKHITHFKDEWHNYIFSATGLVMTEDLEQYGGYDQLVYKYVYETFFDYGEFLIPDKENEWDGWKDFIWDCLYCHTINGSLIHSSDNSRKAELILRGIYGNKFDEVLKNRGIT